MNVGRENQFRIELIKRTILNRVNAVLSRVYNS